MVPLAGVLLTALFFQLGYALECLSCGGITHPRNCDLVTTCAFGEVCYAQSVTAHDGRKVYLLGCKARNDSRVCSSSNNTSSCSECCETNLCNAQLCGEQGYPANRGPVCYRCESRLMNEACAIIDFCTKDEVCSYVQKKRFADIVYTSGCIPKNVCNTSHHGDILIGKKKRKQHRVIEDASSPSTCERCCTGDLCNQGCHPAHDCLDILSKGLGTSTGVYTITTPLSQEKVNVFCDMDTDGGGWTVFQMRYNGQVDFYQNMAAYVSGFGQKDGEFWLGLKVIRELSTCSESVLRLDLEKADGTKRFEIFRNFSLTPGPDYTLHIERGSGTLGDSNGLSYNNGHNFYTFDHDDASKCAVLDHGGWWYDGCTHANLNGEYMHPPGSKSSKNSGEGGMIYYDFDARKSLKSSKMMIRRHSTSKC